jgi:hypothetical protein
MTIARRLILLLATPFLALLGLGVFATNQLGRIESQSRIVGLQVNSSPPWAAFCAAFQKPG